MSWTMGVAATVAALVDLRAVVERLEEEGGGGAALTEECGGHETDDMGEASPMLVVVVVVVVDGDCGGCGVETSTSRPRQTDVSTVSYSEAGNERPPVGVLCRDYRESTKRETQTSAFFAKILVTTSEVELVQLWQGVTA